MSLKKLNQEIAKYGVELVKGDGYFYFYSLDDRCLVEHFGLESIYVCHFNQVNYATWMDWVMKEIAKLPKEN